MRKIDLAALGAVALALSATPALAAVTLTATLNGANETGGGDADGSGNFSGQLDVDTGDVCFTLSTTKVAAATAAHIHEGAAGVDGKPVVTIEVTGANEDSCVAAEPDLLKALVAAPEAYYVNVHTADYPKGAVRGQLSAAAK